MADWTLHLQLAADTVNLGDLPLSRVLVMSDATFPWLVLVPRKADLVEVIDLGDDQQTQLMREVAQTARALRELTACDKLNLSLIHI